MGHLYFGDNLEVLRNNISNESVDLIYLDPPFNSKRDYNLLFKTAKGNNSDASLTAFEDSWHWGHQAEREFDELINQANCDVAEMIQAFRIFLGENDLMAYLVMMCNRLLELHRVLKPAGSLYLHCDPTASHYLKIVLDGVFGKQAYRSEISWKRSSSHNDGKQGRKQYGNVRDVILFYTKSKEWHWVWQYTPYSESYVRNNYCHIHPVTKRRFRLGDLTAAKPGGDVSYDFMGTRPYKGRYWAYSKENMQKFHDEGRLYFPTNGGTPSYIRYLDEMPGVPLQNSWDDIMSATGKEVLGYQTQKPLALLERIITASCPSDGVVLDPFCGCGTAVHVAEKLGRQWLGIDITHLAISVIEERLRRHFPSIRFETHGTPKDLESAKSLAKRDKYEFQYWVCHLLGAQPYQNKKKGADGGIDGILYFKDVGQQHKKIIVSVKGGENVSVSMIRDLGHVVTREKAEIGLFVTLAEPTRPMMEEAVKAGYYAPNFVRNKFPRMQIITIQGLLKGTEMPEYPSLDRGGVTVRTRKGQPSKQLPLLFTYEGKRKEEPEAETLAATTSQQLPKPRSAAVQKAV